MRSSGASSPRSATWTSRRSSCWSSRKSRLSCSITSRRWSRGWCKRRFDSSEKSSLVHDLPANQRVTHPARKFIADEGCVLSLAFQGIRGDLDVCVWVEHAQVRVAGDGETPCRHAQDRRRFGSHQGERLGQGDAHFLSPLERERQQQL